MIENNKFMCVQCSKLFYTKDLIYIETDMDGHEVYSCIPCATGN